MVQVEWKVTYRVTARWSKRQNLAIAVGERVTLCVVSSVRVSRFLSCDLIGFLSRVIAPNLRAAAAAVAAALEGRQEVAVLARNAIAAARLVTLRVRAPRRPEVVQEATAVAGVAGEATVVLGAGAVKKHGALSCPFRDARGVLIPFVFVFFLEVTPAVE